MSNSRIECTSAPPLPHLCHNSTTPHIHPRCYPTNQEYHPRKFPRPTIPHFFPRALPPLIPQLLPPPPLETPTLTTQTSSPTPAKPHRNPGKEKVKETRKAPSLLPPLPSPSNSLLHHPFSSSLPSQKPSPSSLSYKTQPTIYAFTKVNSPPSQRCQRGRRNCLFLCFILIYFIELKNF